MFETHNCLQTYNLKLKIVQKILRNYDKELVKAKGQMNRVQHENQNLSNKLKEAKQVVRKIENLQQKYARLN
jgi:ribosome-binding protein aMBF1 (putative translation factor)